MHDLGVLSRCDFIAQNEVSLGASAYDGPLLVQLYRLPD